VRHGSIVLEVNVEPVLLEVLCHHHAGLNDACLLRKIPLAKDLAARQLI
jgi:hypothetical protein